MIVKIIAIVIHLKICFVLFSLLNTILTDAAAKAAIQGKSSSIILYVFYTLWKGGGSNPWPFPKCVKNIRNGRGALPSIYVVVKKLSLIAT